MDIPAPGIIPVALVKLDRFLAAPAPDTGGGDVCGSNVGLKVSFSFDRLDIGFWGPLLGSVSG